jgi:hypothetical protein
MLGDRAMTASPGQSRWRSFTTGRKVVKGVGGGVTFLAALVALFLGLGELGWLPFGGDDPPLASAAAKVSDAGSARVVFETRTLSGDSEPEVAHAQGAMDFRAEVANFDFSSGAKMRMQKPYLYLQGPESRVWCEYDLSALGGGFFFGALTGFKSDPGVALTNLEENGSYEKVGAETLFGVPTTHYSGQVELDRFREEDVNPEVRQLLQEASELNDGRIPVDVWLGPEAVVSRLKTSIRIGQDVQTEATFDFSHYGATVVVKLPPQSTRAAPGTKGCPSRLG